MLKLTLLLLSLQAFAIIDGQLVTSGSKHESFNVSWNIQGHHFCSGVVISNKHILTAAHCVPNRFHTVKFGNSTQLFKVAKIYIHPFFRKDLLSQPLPNQQVNDLAVLELMQSIPQSVKPIDIYTEIILPGRTFLFGYGKDSFSGRMGPLRLKQVELLDYLVESGEWVTSFAACGGDSGGPLVFESDSGELKLIGITSRSDLRDSTGNCLGPAIQTDLIHQSWWLSQFTIK